MDVRRRCEERFVILCDKRQENKIKRLNCLSGKRYRRSLMNNLANTTLILGDVLFVRVKDLRGQKANEDRENQKTQ